MILQDELAAAQDKIALNCIKKLGYYGNNGERSEFSVFDQTKTIAAFLPPSHTPLSYISCTDPGRDNRMVSFSIKFADKDGDDEFTIPIVGSEGGECETIENTNRENAAAMLIYQDDAGINGLQIKTRGEKPEVITIGNPLTKKSERKLFSFSDQFDLIGFYGLQNEKAVRTLGLVVKNNQC